MTIVVTVITGTNMLMSVYCHTLKKFSKIIKNYLYIVLILTATSNNKHYKYKVTQLVSTPYDFYYKTLLSSTVNKTVNSVTEASTLAIT